MTTNEIKEGVILNVNKPFEWTSFDVVKKIRNTVRRLHRLSNVKVGHAGTLDPLATGVLLVCIGKATKQVDTLMHQEKEYSGTLVLGATTASYDLETEVVPAAPIDHLTTEMVKEATQSFLGDIEQMPPHHSAKKIDGKKAYDLARAGKEVNLKPAKVHIREFEITRVELPEVDFRITCSKGTYIRSIANDFGKELGTGGYLASLCRTRNGKYSVENSLDLDKVSSFLSTEPQKISEN